MKQKNLNQIELGQVVVRPDGQDEIIHDPDEHQDEHQDEHHNENQDDENQDDENQDDENPEVRNTCLRIVWIERLIAFIGIILGTGGSCFGTITLIDGINNFFVDVTPGAGQSLLYVKLLKIGSGSATIATSLYLYEEAYCRLYRALTVTFTYIITILIIAYSILAGGSDRVAAIIIIVIMESLTWLILAYIDVGKKQSGSSNFFQAARKLPNKEKRKLKQIIQLVSAPSCFLGMAVGIILLGDEFKNMYNDKGKTSTYSGHLDNLETFAGITLTCAVVLTVISEIKKVLGIAIFIGLLVLRVGLFVFGIIDSDVGMIIGAVILLTISVVTFPIYFIRRDLNNCMAKLRECCGCCCDVFSRSFGFIGVIIGIGGICFGIITFVDGVSQLYVDKSSIPDSSTDISYRFTKIASGSATLATSLYIFEEAYWRIYRWVTCIVVGVISILICVYGIYADGIDRTTSIGFLVFILLVIGITFRYLENEQGNPRFCGECKNFCCAVPQVEAKVSQDSARALKFLIQLLSAPTCFIGIIAGFILLCDEFNNMRLDQHDQKKYTSHLDYLETYAGIILTCAVVLTVMDDIKKAVGTIILISMIIFSIGLFISGGISKDTPMLVSAAVLMVGFIVGVIIQCVRNR